MSRLRARQRKHLHMGRRCDPSKLGQLISCVLCCLPLPSLCPLQVVSQRPPKESAQRRDTGGLLHMFPLGQGCPVPKELQELEYQYIIVELFEKACSLLLCAMVFP